MKKSNKKNSFLMSLFAMLCAFSIGAAGCAGEDVDSSSSGASVEDSVGGSSTPDYSSTPDDSSDVGDDITPDNSETPEDAAISILLPEGEVFPYVDTAKDFLQAGEGADVADYAVSGMKNPQAPVQVKWKYNGEGTKKFIIEYATKADYSDAITLEMGAAKRSVELYNLYKGVNYYLRITSVNSTGDVLNQAKTQFQTTDLGPRVMNVEGAYNVRDLGGFDTCFGKQLVQGIAYRGGMLHYNATGNNGDLTENGKKTLSEELGVTSELDFRDENEAYVKLEDGSSIPGATLTYITAGGYEDIFKGAAGSGAKEVYRKIFSYLADETNYPLYYHCTAGADRTGTVSYILHAFLGVSELECHQDFAFTSFSVYGVRASQSGRGSNAERYLAMVAALKAYEGDTLQQKAQNYLLSIGVTEAELENLKGIFFGEVEIPGAKTYNPNTQTTPTPSAKARMNTQAREVLDEDGYTSYTVTGVNVQPSGSTSKTLYIYSIEGDGLPKSKGNWDDVYTLEVGSGAGLTLNGEPTTSGRIKMPGDLYLPLDKEPNVGDVLVIDGTYSNANSKVRLVFVNCALQWDGTVWKHYANNPSYTTYNLGELSVHRNSDGTSSNPPLATQLYMKIASGMEIPFPDAEWDTEFALESGAGWKLNGQSITLSDIESTNSGLFVNLKNANVQVGDILSVEGTFMSADVSARYVIAESKFIWNGTAWQDYVDADPIEYTTYEIGMLKFDKVTSSNDKPPVENGYAYFLRMDGQKLPIYSKEDDLNWHMLFNWKDGVGITINGASVTASVKFPSQMFISIKQAPQVGDILKIGGTFYNEEYAVQYIIEESVFEWDGTAWQTCVEYTTYEVGALAFQKATQTNDQTPIANGYVYFVKENGESLPVYSTENNLHWETKYSWKDGVGITINDVAVLATVKFPKEMFIAFKSSPQIGDVLKIGGTFYNDTLLVRYIIEESAFEWDGTAWIPQQEYAEYEVGKLTVAGGQTSNGSIALSQADGGSFAVNDLSYAFNFFGGSGVGVLLNGESLPVNTVKTSVTELYLNLGVSVKEGDVVRIGGVYYNVNKATRYIITESAFIYENGVWAVYDKPYTEIGVGSVNVLDDLSDKGYIYFASSNSALIFPVDSWDDAFVSTFGAGVQLNGKALANAKICSVDSTIYLSLRSEGVQVGSVIIIGGKFVCEAQNVLYYVTESSFVWNGNVWVEMSKTNLSEVKAAAKAELDGYKVAADYDETVQVELASIIAAAKTEIDGGSSFADVSAIVSSAKAAMDQATKVQTPDEPDEPEAPNEPSTGETNSSSEEPSSGCGSFVGMAAGGAVLAAVALGCFRKRKED